MVLRVYAMPSDCPGWSLEAERGFSSDKKKGSSPISGECGPDLQEEIGVVTEAIGHPLDDFDPVVDALNQVGAQGPVAMRQDAGHQRFEVAGELLERSDSAVRRTPEPLLPKALGVAVMAIAPESLQVVFHQVHGEEGPVGRQQLAQSHLIGLVGQVVAVAQKQPARSLDQSSRR